MSSQTQRGASTASRPETYAGSAVRSSTSRSVAVDHLHALARQPGEVDARHGDTFAQATDDAPDEVEVLTCVPLDVVL